MIQVAIAVKPRNLDLLKNFFEQRRRKQFGQDNTMPIRKLLAQLREVVWSQPDNFSLRDLKHCKARGVANSVTQGVNRAQLNSLRVLPDPVSDGA